MQIHLHIIKGALISGFLSTLVGLCVNRIIFHQDKVGQWSKDYVMELSLFFTGFFMHLLCEITGINNVYCKGIIYHGHNPIHEEE